MYWLAVFLMLAVLVWVWWQFRQPPEPKLSPPARQKTNTASIVRRLLPPVSPPLTNTPSVAAVRINHFTPAPITSTPPTVMNETNLTSGLSGVFPRPVRDVFEAQLVLARQAISSGSLDGLMGPQTRAALLAFQRKAGLPETATLDADTRARLRLTAPPFTNYLVTSNDLARLQPLSPTWLGKSEQTALDFETILELVAEKSRAHPNLIRRLNPNLDWTNVAAGAVCTSPGRGLSRAG